MRSEEIIVNPLTSTKEPRLTADEIAFVADLLTGARIEDARDRFALPESSALSAINRAANYLHARVGDHIAKSTGTSGLIRDFESELGILQFAVEQLPPRALASLGVRSVQRLLPFVASFAETLPNGREQFRVTQEALRGVARFAGGEPLPPELADLAAAVVRFERSTGGLSSKTTETRAHSCLFFANCTLRFVLGSDEEGGRLDFWTACKAYAWECPDLPGLLRAIAVDASHLLQMRTGIDSVGGLDKLGEESGPPGSNTVLPLLGPLWPEGEPVWYRQEAARMKDKTADLSSPVTESEGVVADEAVSTQVRISPLAFLRSMAILFWSAFRHPLKTTEIDLSTGRVIRHY